MSTSTIATADELAITAINDPNVSLGKGHESEEYRRPLTKTQWVLVCVGLYAGAIFYGLDTTIAADVQGPILESLGEIEKLAWVGIAFPMGSVAMIPLFGTFYGLFEIKCLVLLSYILFEIGSFLCGAAPTMNAMILGRVIAGAGGAGTYLGGLNYFANFTSIRKRPVYNACIGLCWGTGCILGPVIGGSFADSRASWRWAFYINLPLAALCSPINIWLYPKFNPQPYISSLDKLTKVDWVGAILNASTYCLLMVALTFSGSTWAWNQSETVAIWVLFGVSLATFVIQSTFSIFTIPERRIFPVQFLRSRTLVLLYFTTAAAATGLAVAIYYIPLLFQFTKGDSALQAAVRLLPFVALNVFFAILSGALLPFFGRYILWYIPSSILIIFGGILMFLISPATKTAAIYGFETLIAIGCGLTQQIGYSIAAAKVRPHEAPAAITFITLAQVGSMAIALSISGAIFQNVGFTSLKAVLAEYSFTDEQIRNALAGTQSAILAHGSNTLRELAIGSIEDTIAKLFALVTAAGVLMFVSALFMKHEQLQLSLVTGA